ncbi:hypothetical protein [Nocardia miyunensis]|uniref:hypothetical protein n=1 Tax=Nocardia miyunensis TaxID=282684 RepID=UPI00082E69A4|nr:hypothetical protein [Nocardia miyunensis]
MSASPQPELEFLSDAWIDRAAGFLRDNANGASFSFCESFADPPPGILGSWHAVIREGVVVAGPGTAEGTDLRVESDYQAMLAMAQTVYAAGPESVGRAHREMVHRHGPGVMRISGDTPRAVRGLLTGLHDHMAACTIENPHLDHRVRRLGLAQHVSELAEAGHTLVPGAISEALADELREQVNFELQVRNSVAADDLLIRHRLFEEIALHPIANTLAQSVLGPDVILAAMIGRHVSDRSGTPDDAASGDSARARPDAPARVTARWILDDSAGDGGSDPLPPKGSLDLRTGRSRTLPNPASFTLESAYARFGTARPSFVDAIGTEHLERNPPAFRTLVGSSRD